MTLLKSPSTSQPADPTAPLTAGDLLRGICLKPALHARFLNTLSLMEHIGSRKILLSRKDRPWAEDVLRHLAEETRHAHFFRRAAEKFAARAMDYRSEDLLAPASARMYMERLDGRITRELGADRLLAYRYVTLAVELRAQSFYGLYEEVLRSEGSPLTLRSVLAEEDGHLREMTESLSRTDPRYASRRTALAALESGLFDRWLAAIRAAAV